MTVVRDAGIDDIDALIRLGEMMRAESSVYYPPIERDVVERYIAMAVENRNSMLIAIAEDEIPVGMITAVAGPYCFSSRIRSASDLLFVIPERRGGSAAARLVRRYCEWSDAIGSDSATMSISTGVSPERTGRFFERMGFRPMEMNYKRYRDVHGV